MEDYVTYEQAVRLKELGLDCAVLFQYNDEFFEPNQNNVTNEYGYYNTYDLSMRLPVGCIPAPTLAQAAKWLREVKGIVILIDTLSFPEPYYWKLKNNKFEWIDSSEERFDTYEEALSAGIDKALELL